MHTRSESRRTARPEPMKSRNLRVQSSEVEAGAECMAHGMGRDVRQGFFWLVVLVVLPDKPLEHTLVTGRRFGKAALVEEQEVSVALLAHPDGPFLGVRQLHAVNAPGTQGILFQNGHQVFPALLGAPLDILPMAVLPGVKLADRHLLADGVDPIVNVPQEPVHHKDFPVLLGQPQKRLGQPVVLNQDHGPSHREGRVFPRVAVIYRKLGHFCLGQLFSSPFAHYSFTNGPVWPVFWIYLKKFFAAHTWLLSFRSG